MSDVADQNSEKMITLSIKAAKIDAKVLAAAMKVLLKGGGKIVKNMTAPKDMAGKGQQTVKQLVKQGKGVTNIPINDKNIKAFESIARKYGVDFALKKDSAVTPPKWLVFFKAQDADVITAAFKEFVAKQAKVKTAKPSVLASLQKFSELVKTQVVDKVKNKVREVFK